MTLGDSVKLRPALLYLLFLALIAPPNAYASPTPSPTPSQCSNLFVSVAKGYRLRERPNANLIVRALGNAQVLSRKRFFPKNEIGNSIRIEMRDGSSINGVLAAETHDSITLTLENGATLVIPKNRDFINSYQTNELAVLARRYVRNEDGALSASHEYLYNMVQAEKAATSYVRVFSSKVSFESFVNDHLREQHLLISGKSTGTPYQGFDYMSDDAKIVGPGRFRDEVEWIEVARDPVQAL